MHTNRENRSFMRSVKQIDSRIWWTSQGMDWGWGQGIKSHHTSYVLPGLRRRRTGLLPSDPKSSFQMRASFVFHLETKVLESGGRVEKLIAQVAWSPVLSFHSLWWFGVQCHLLVLVHCVFWKPTSLHRLPNILENFMLPSADQLFKDADFIFQQDLAHAHTAKAPKVGLNDHGVGVLDLTSKLTRPEPHRESMRYCQEENEKQETKCYMSWSPLSKKPGLPYHLSSATNWSPPCHTNWGSNKAKGAPLPSIEYIYSILNITSRRPTFTENVFLLVLWSILICWDVNVVFVNVSQNHHN